MKKFLLLFLAITMIIPLAYAETSSTNHYQTAQQRVCKIERECLAATTEANFETLNQVCNRKDEAALKRMIATGQVYILTPSMTIRMVDHGFAKCKVYVVDLGIEVWVSTDFIEYK